MNVLIIEDDASVGRFLRQALVEAGYRAVLETDGAAGFVLAQDPAFELILLDRMLGGIDGLKICRDLRARGIQKPILILTARDALEDKVSGLDAGADDYLVKPFQLAELLARVRALGRRPPIAAGPLQVGSLSLDPLQRLAQLGKKTVGLSTTEFALLEYLMRNGGRVLTRSMILQHVWQYDFEGNDKVLDVYISYLRKKLDNGGPSWIETIRGTGYRLRSPSEEVS
ncbi:MAG TPA: response regulator transcription factor [Fimbriimonadaceae bacterium]|nr:response regulator transcription factor [Fimbriimonadaceae bacterium]